MGQGAVINLLKKKGNRSKYLSTQEIANKLKLNHSTAGSLLKRLYKSGFIIREVAYRKNRINALVRGYVWKLNTRKKQEEMF